MNQKVAVRDLEANDRNGWAPLWRGYQDFYAMSVTDAVTDISFERFLDPTEPMFALVAALEGRLVGFTHCILHRSTSRAGYYCYLQDLFVASDARKGGIGRALIEAVYARADAMGAERVYWLTHETNAEARALYDKVALSTGFIQYRRA